MNGMPVLLPTFDQLEPRLLLSGAPLADQIAPAVLTQVLNGGSDSRSIIATLAMQFSEAVVVAKGDLTLHDDTHDVSVDISNSTFAYDAGTQTATWDFSAIDLANAYYTAALSGNTVTDTQGNKLDGDGTIGGDHLVSFHQLLGDANGDSIVDVADLGVLGGNYGRRGVGVPGDVNLNGVVDVGDLSCIGISYGSKLIDTLTLAPIGNKVVRPGQTVQFTVHATDPNGGPVTYSAQNLPAGATFDAATATLTWTPAPDQTRPFTGIRFIASKGGTTRHKDITITPNLNPLGTGATNAYYIDNDMDGYGVGSPLGPDANDADPAVNTPDSMLAKYGTLTNFLTTAKGYNPLRIFYIATNGNDATGDGSLSQPFATWTRALSCLQAGSMFVYRAGDYSATPSIGLNIHGTEADPIIVMSYPGEKVTLRNPSGGWGIWVGQNVSYVVYDGFTIDGHNADGNGNYGISLEGSSYGVAAPVEHVTFRNIDSSGNGMELSMNSDGWVHNITFENNIFHESVGSHIFYLGVYARQDGDYVFGEGAAERALLNITIRNNIIYGGGGGGGNGAFQINGPCSNAIIEGNIIHDSMLNGMQLYNGVSNSIVRNNLIFNNGNGGILFWNYQEQYSDRPQRDNISYNNQIVNNTIWVGEYHPATWQPTSTYYAAITIDGLNGRDAHDFVISNNILYTQNGPAIEFQNYAQDINTFAITNNLIYRQAGSAYILQMGGGYAPAPTQQYSFEQFQALNTVQNNVFADPLFQDASVGYFQTANRFQFDLLATSPALGLGSVANAPTADLRGNLRLGLIDVGCYEY